MITETEFKQSLDIVNKYIYELNQEINVLEGKKNKTDIKRWVLLKKHELRSKNIPKTNDHTRLFTALLSNYDCGYTKYIEDVKIGRLRNVGKKTGDLFFELSGVDG